ncbi:hypothetical protein B0H17DRAFT_1065533 [Mycena rosella]|uniref:Uncharacterized protein n=1 Tax=Mycena rosella TaxID=1033263 RepID=A0AAD7DH35_MYCRO|nr:hypothetical protein B0H17DRAFT_1065533 [Mycena rosella]
MMAKTLATHPPPRRSISSARLKPNREKLGLTRRSLANTKSDDIIQRPTSDAPKILSLYSAGAGQGPA